MIHHVTRTVPPRSPPLHGAPTSVNDSAAATPATAEHRNVPVEPAEDRLAVAGTEADEPVLQLGRILWGITAAVFLAAALILVIGRRYGYSEVTFAVAVAAAINVL